jgi:hypothetical protein
LSCPREIPVRIYRAFFRTAKFWKQLIYSSTDWRNKWDIVVKINELLPTIIWLKNVAEKKLVTP